MQGTSIVRLSSLLSWGILGFLWSITRVASGSPTQLCSSSACCNTCVLQDCETDRLDPHCKVGAALASVTNIIDPTGQACKNDCSPLAAACEEQCEYNALKAYNACQIECDQIVEDGGPIGKCKAHVLSVPEVPGNGIDDNCDGVFPGEDICNGKDDNGDNKADNLPGSCAERHLFIPYCWRSTGADPIDEIKAAVERWEGYFARKSGLAGCPDRLPVYYEIAPFLNATSCDPLPGKDMASFWEAFRRQGTPGVDLSQWDVVAFVTNPSSIEGLSIGQSIGWGAMHLLTGGLTPLYDGEFGSFVHEYGHAIGLSDEYYITQGEFNPLEAGPDYKCDAGDAQNVIPPPPPPYTKAYYDSLGPCCYLYPPGCSSDPSAGSSFCAIADVPPGNQTGYRCRGNIALQLDDWQEGDPDPGFYPDPDAAVDGDEGRCIMTSARGLGWDRGDATTGLGNQRGWCKHCWQRFKAVAPKCSSAYAGDQRRVSLYGTVNPNTLALFVNSADVGMGRIGAPPPANGRVLVAVSDASGASIGQFVPPSPEQASSSADIGFWARIPIAADQDLPLKVALSVDGQPISSVTAGGQPPVAVAYDQVVECASSAGTEVTLNGSASSDPEGDTLYYSWTADAGVTLSGADRVIATGVFPLGTEPVMLTVQDGTRQSSSAIINVTVQDTTPPAFASLPTLRRTVCAPSAQSTLVPLATPVVTDACSASVAVTGTVILKNGQPASIPVAGGEVDLSAGTYTVQWTAIDAQGNAITATQTIEVLPALLADGVLDVRDRAQIRATGGGYAAIGNLGTGGQTLLGVNAQSGTIESRAGVWLRNDARVYGDLLTEGGVELGSGASVSGVKRSQTSVQLPSKPNLAGLIFPGGDEVSVAEGTLGVAPGSYGVGWVNTNARLVLTAGDYYFHDLTLESGSTVEAPATGLRIFVEEQFTFRGRLIDAAATPVPVDVTVAGTSPVWVEAPLAGHLVAPDAEVKIARSFAGGVVARNLLVEPDVVATCVADGVGFCSAAHPSGFCPDDGNSCTVAVCGAVGCTYPAGPDGTQCSDGDECTTGDLCTSGVCTGTPLACDDGNPCTADGCSAGGCTHTNLPNGTGCNDSNSCTASDVCTNGTCAGTAVAPAAPSNLTATASNSNSVALNWAASATPGVTYVVRRGTSSGSWNTTVASGLSSTTFQESGLTAGTRYFYVVAAVGCSNSPNSNEVSATASGSPTVSISSPTNNTAFAAPATVTIVANASDPGGAISKVEFYRGGTLLGTDTTQPYSFVWSNVAAGNYVLTAKAFDNLNASTVSGAVNVVVAAASTPCGGLCSPAIVKAGPSIQSGNLGTGAICHETMSSLSGGNCSNMAGRTLKVNGAAMNCNGWSLPAKRSNGYCIEVTGGGYSYASYATW